jgi:hypothetical protein
MTKSCGCLSVDTVRTRSLKHGRSHTKDDRTYKSWTEMRARCLNVWHPKFPGYGGRGITIDPRWDEFLLFVEDMGERPLGTTLDRKDNSKGYCKDNCRWADPKTQARNKRGLRIITFNGRSQCLSSWCEELGLSYHKVYQRLFRLGHTPEQAFRP